MSHIILSGIDKTGKSTLARELSKKFYMPVVNRLKPEKDIFTECCNLLTESKEDFIVDRFHLDELAYGPVKRGNIRFDFREYKIIEMLMLAQQTFNIYCYDEQIQLAKRFKECNETFLKEEEIWQTLLYFESALKDSMLEWHKYRIGDDIEQLMASIEKWNTQVITKDINKFKGYRTIGNLEGSVLFIGEKYGDALELPLVPFGRNKPGLMFFKAIEESSLDWKEVILTNAIKQNDRSLRGEFSASDKIALEQELKLKRLKSVICLGNKAYDYAMELKPERFDMPKNLKIKKISHPAYAFAYNDWSIEKYAEEINKCL